MACALVHHPALDRAGAVVTTAITNLDLHDIARSAHTYGLERYFVVHPVGAQRELVDRVRSHWVEGSGGRRIPDRRPAIELLEPVSTFDEAVRRFAPEGTVEVWMTSARSVVANPLEVAEARSILATAGPPVLIVFGTGWGLPDAMVRSGQRVLSPIASPRPDGYNHLSVRAAAAIYFDRLLSRQLGAGPPARDER